MLKPAFMAATLLLLLTLVVVTPRLIGPPEDISSLPRIILNFDEGSLIVFVTSLSGTYLYEALFIEVTPSPGPEPILRNASRSMALEERIPLDVMASFRLEAGAVDGLGQRFEVLLDVVATESSDGWTVRLLESGSPPRVYAGPDLQNVPLFATLMERRTAA
ncbi:MAG: hypothetical protein ACE5KQ_05290 [Thermoplasmata archaeon]